MYVVCTASKRKMILRTGRARMVIEHDQTGWVRCAPGSCIVRRSKEEEEGAKKMPTVVGHLLDDRKLEGWDQDGSGRIGFFSFLFLALGLTVRSRSHCTVVGCIRALSGDVYR